MYQVLRRDWHAFDYWTLTIATHPIAPVTEEAQKKVCSEPLTFKRTLSFAFPNANFILAVSHLGNPLSLSHQSPHLFLVIFIFHILM